MAASRNFRRIKPSKDFIEPFGEINTTPLVDVMLVLLIIFLITIPVINASIKVELPEDQFPDKVTNDQTAVISVTKEKGVFFNSTFLGNLMQDKETLVNLLKSNKVTSIQIHGDSRVSFDKIEFIIDQVRSADVEKITLVTKP